MEGIPPLVLSEYRCLTHRHVTFGGWSARNVATGGGGLASSLRLRRREQRCRLIGRHGIPGHLTRRSQEPLPDSLRSFGLHPLPISKMGGSPTNTPGIR